MGLFRRKKEEAPPGGSGIEGFEDGKVPWASDRESIGRPVQGQAPGQGLDLAALGVPTDGAAGAYMKAMGFDQVIEQAAQMQENVQIDASQSQQTIDASNTELGEKLTEIMRRHGMDPSSALASTDATKMAAMQQEMMEALGQAGAAAAESGEGASTETRFEIRTEEPGDPPAGSGS
jgi:hypothetical protein